MRPGRCAKQFNAAYFRRWMFNRPSARLVRYVLPLAFAAFAWPANIALADEGGVSFWLPGQFGSLAAAPLTPGLTVTEIYYHANVAGGGDVAASRAITIGQFTPTLNVNFNGSVHGAADLVFGTATYVFATPVMGGQ